jgi:hypothetical protein
MEYLEPREEGGLYRAAFGGNGGGAIDCLPGTRWVLEFEGHLHSLTVEKPNTAITATAGFTFWF